MSRRLILLVDALEGTGLQAVENGVWEESILASEFGAYEPSMSAF